MFKKDPFLLILTILFIGLIIYNPHIIKEIPFLVESNTLIILFTFMLITKGLEFSGYLNQIADMLIEKAFSERLLAFYLILIELIISPLVTNDISLFLIIPITLSISKKIKFNVERLIIFEIWAANIGSSLFPIGNPQNIYIYQISNIKFFEFIVKMIPFEVIEVSLLFIVIYFSFTTKKVKIRAPIPIAKNRLLFIISTFLLILSILFVDYKLQLIALIITLVIYLIFNLKIIYYGTNINLLLIFVLLFIIIGGIREIEVINKLLFSIKDTFFPALILSQFISNVPTTLILSSYTTSYTHLLYGVNLAGNGTMISSLANLIGIRLGNVNIKKFHMYSFLFLTVSTFFIYLYMKFL